MKLPPGMRRLLHAAFSPQPAIAPAVLSVIHHHRTLPPANPILRVALPHWVLDYSPQSGLRMRVAAEDAPWWERGARVCHCYAPGTVFWEDWSALPGPGLAGLSFIVRDAADGALRRATGGRPWIAIEDPQGLLEAVFARTFADGPPSFWTAQESLAGILGLIAAATPGTDGRFRLDDVPSAPSCAQAVDAMLRRDLGTRWSLDRLARALALDRSTLCRRHRAETGTSPMARLARLRIDLVQALLIAGSSLADAARAAGFCDQFHCSRVFRRITGLPPSGFLRRRTTARGS